MKDELVGQSMANLVNMHDVSFFQDDRRIFDNISLTVPRGKVAAVMGLPDIGKTTLLRLIGGQIPLDKGETLFDDESVPAMSRSRLFIVRKHMSMLLQPGALFTDMNVFDNVAYPLHEHTTLSAPLLKNTVMMKLEVIGSWGATKLTPSELSGEVACRAALARAIALEPDPIMSDELFIGQDPITMGVLMKLISELNSALGATCVVVPYDVPEVLSIADYVCIMMDKKIVVYGNAQVLQENANPCVRQFLDGIADGPIPFHYPAGDYHIDLLKTGSQAAHVVKCADIIRTSGNKNPQDVRVSRINVIRCGCR